MNVSSMDLGALGESPWAAPSLMPSADLPRSTDVAIVGAGLAGLSAACELARNGVDVTVIDAAFGGGATARSGGIILGGTLVGPHPAFTGCERELQQWISDEEIACDLTPTRCAELARDESLPAAPVDWLDAGRLRVAGDVPAALVDPVKLLNGVLAAAARHGARLVNGTRLTRLSSSNQRVRVVTEHDEFDAELVLLAVDATSWAASPLQDPFPDRTLTVVLETTPIDAAVARAAGLDRLGAFYSKELPLLWGRPTAGGRYLFGRELVAFPWADTSPDQLRRVVHEAGDRLVRRVRGLHPALAEVAVHRVWAGPTARNASGVPSIVPDASPAFVSASKEANVWWLGGCGGHGLAQSFRLGQSAALKIVQRLQRRVTAS